MEFSAQQIANVINGKIEGNAACTVSGFSKIEEGKTGTLTFLANPKYAAYIYETKASIALVNNNFQAEKSLPETLTLIRVPDAYAALAQLLAMVDSYKPKKQGIENPCFISSSAKVSQNAYIGAFAYIGNNAAIGENVAIYPQTYIGDNVTIDDNTTVYAGVKIYENCKIGKRCIIHAGAVIGADGFGFAKEDGHFKKIPQLGNVVIEDDVEIGANTTIDRAVMDSTVIRRGVKLDNLIQIAHNVEIGEDTAIAAQAGISGSTKIGKNNIIAGQAGFVGHIHTGDSATFGAQAGVTNSVKAGATVGGSPALELKNYLRSSVLFKKLPEIYKDLEMLREEIKLLKQKNN